MAWPKTHTPMWPTRLTWLCLYGPYDHTHTVTQLCLAHDHTYDIHTVVSCTWQPH
ncbi:hypothetical protein J1N35_029160, partial [Gossypium stocksii]